MLNFFSLFKMMQLCFTIVSALCLIKCVFPKSKATFATRREERGERKSARKILHHRTRITYLKLPNLLVQEVINPDDTYISEHRNKEGLNAF